MIFIPIARLCQDDIPMSNEDIQIESFSIALSTCHSYMLGLDSIKCHK